MAGAARDAGVPADRVRHFDDSRQAAAAVAGLVGDGDVVLVKGSRGTHMDVIADRLQEAG
jgi:UDP-N-acetylmuramyl pentapeptide synthase